jgi:hypothetical protein
MALVAAGCSSGSESSGELGTVSVNLIVGNSDVDSVSFEITC